MFDGVVKDLMDAVNTCNCYFLSPKIYGFEFSKNS